MSTMGSGTLGLTYFHRFLSFSNIFTCFVIFWRTVVAFSQDLLSFGKLADPQITWHFQNAPPPLEMPVFALKSLRQPFPKEPI